ncbi:MAG: hypothetical protein QOJ99_1913 [Bryobacterales bacterium]|nr:hypothetical protein [Bryobacterales bacterium]
MGFTRIDVHAHFLPDFYNDALVEAGQTHPDGMQPCLYALSSTRWVAYSEVLRSVMENPNA